MGLWDWMWPFGGTADSDGKRIKDAAKDGGIPEVAIRHKNDGRKARNDGYVENLSKNIEKRAKKKI